MATLIKCKTCGKEISSSAGVCPNCGQKLKTGLVLKIVIGFIVLFFISGVLSQIGKDKTIAYGSSSNNQNITNTQSKPDLELLNHSVQTDSHMKYVVGTIKNNTNKKYSYAQVEINLYDKSGAQIGSTLANINNFEPGASWKFKAIIVEDGASTYKIKDITAF